MSIIKLFLQEGILIEPSLLDFFKINNITYDLVDIIKALGIKFLSKDALSQNHDRIVLFLEREKNGKSNEEKDLIQKTIGSLSVFKTELKLPIKPVERRKEYPYKILESWKIASKKLDVGDFVNHFKSRYISLKSILQERADLTNLTSINKISGQRQASVSIIGIVIDKHITKNKNLLFKLEDLTGTISVLVNTSKEELYKKGQNVLLDDIIAVKASGSSEFLFANDLFFPDAISIKREENTEDYAAFISDIHCGSSMFLEEEFSRFISWLNLERGTEEQKNLAKKVKYLFISGDTVDGVGIYPGQEDALKIKNVKDQYIKLAGYLNQIRKDITIFHIPGQHDAVRVAEPQPAIGEFYAESMTQIENLILLSNPAMVEVSGRKILMYHGASFHNVIDDIEELRLANAHNTPSKVVKELLLRRHLAPTHASTVYIPNADVDPLSIREIPDIVATGELHKIDVSTYNNIRLIASSCWQSQTPFEEKVGNMPEPCKVPIMNLRNLSVKIMDFS